MMRDHICGCYIYNSEARRRTYLPQVHLDAHTTILSTASRTVLTQTFLNGSEDALDEIRYTFPLYDGVSVVDFYCEVGERTIYGLVKEKNDAKKTYEEAKQRGESAALLEQLPEAADVFTTTIGNIPHNAAVKTTIKYVQELKHDAEVDGVRFTMPTWIAPRYGGYPGRYPIELQQSLKPVPSEGISVTVDISMAEGIPIKKIVSPSHPIQVTLGSLSSSTIDEDQSLSRGSATLALGTAVLEKDFILQVVAKDIGVPQAILERHPTLPNQRALMTTLVPKFNLKSQKPEIILIADRSGNLLKSIPLGCTFNICSFGSRHEFLWHESQVYDERTLQQAIKCVQNFDANLGGTETLAAVKACVEARSKDSPTELILLTDGDIWSQDELFSYVSRETESGDVRVFPLGIGGGVSSALIEGVARAGCGFAQMVTDNEKMDSKVVRMLKGALTPHIKDYRLEIKYEDGNVKAVADGLRVHLDAKHSSDKTETKPISLYDPTLKKNTPRKASQRTSSQVCRISSAQLSYKRRTESLLYSPSIALAFLRGTSPQGPLELEIPVESRKDTDNMIHQLAARKATQELEEGRGWISGATIDDTGVLVKEKHPSMYALLQRREAVRLGVEFQVGGKYCSFVAVEANESAITEMRQKALQATMDREEEDWDMINEDAPVSQPGTRLGATSRSRTLVGAMAVGGRLGGSRGGGRGGGRSGSNAMGFFNLSSAATSLMTSRARFCSSTADEAKEEEEESDEDMGCGLFDDVEEASAVEPPSPIESGKFLQSLIALQSFSGAWPSISRLPCQKMGISIAEAKEVVQRLVDDGVAKDVTVAEQYVATAAVISFLEKKMADKEETWELVVEKARTWLQDTVDAAYLGRVLVAGASIALA
ncbi:von Willebrand factor type A domain-containing protein [Bipolaris maydis]|nr:von Willebrand factor type A domain-containing protein [Bipolaris maydis]